MQVEAIKTPYAAPVIAGALVYAYGKVFGRPPPAESSYLMPMGQSAVETGYWRSMFNNNLGNITAGNPAGQDWVLQYPTSHRFRAYASLGDGAVDFLTFLAHRGVMAFADAGDLGGYIGALERACYMGCPPEGNWAAYQAGMSSAMHKYAGITPTPYSEGLLRSFSMTGAVLTGGALIALAAGAAYAIHDGWLDAPKRRRRALARENPLEAELQAIRLSELAPVDLNLRPMSLSRARGSTRPVVLEVYPDVARPVLADGRHRVAVALKEGRQSLPANVREYNERGDVVESYRLELHLDHWPKGSH